MLLRWAGTTRNFLRSAHGPASASECERRMCPPMKTRAFLLCKLYKLYFSEPRHYSTILQSCDATGPLLCQLLGDQSRAKRRWRRHRKTRERNPKKSHLASSIGRQSLKAQSLRCRRSANRVAAPGHRADSTFSFTRTLAASATTLLSSIKTPLR